MILDAIFPLEWHVIWEAHPLTFMRLDLLSCGMRNSQSKNAVVINKHLLHNQQNVVPFGIFGRMVEAKICSSLSITQTFV
jgi:hypothetical protein